MDRRRYMTLRTVCVRFYFWVATHRSNWSTLTAIERSIRFHYQVVASSDCADHVEGLSTTAGLCCVICTL
eukprot:SAG25_NODE_19_length_23408_cov_10.997040_16_plen_70_part_00